MCRQQNEVIGGKRWGKRVREGEGKMILSSCFDSVWPLMLMLYYLCLFLKDSLAYEARYVLALDKTDHGILF